MESKEIRELIELISRSNFKTFELEREGFRMKLVKADSGASTTVVEVASPSQAPGARESSAAKSPGDSAGSDAADANGLFELNSPIVGTFYSAPGPDHPDFVEVGARVKKGQVLCIVEAMKVMNEIESEVDGEVVDVLVSNAQPVEYGEVLFRLRRVP